MKKHTPGPWHVRDGKYGNLVVEYDLKGKHAFNIATLEGRGDELSDTVNAANAALIAAAPELYEALKRMLEPSMTVIEQRAAKALARAALAKAEGR